MSTSRQLELTSAERRKLRANKIKLKEIHHHSVKELQQLLEVPKIRAMELYAFSEFQSVPSIGIMLASDLISIGYYSLKELKGKNPTSILNKYEQQVGVWTDPCVEDCFRLVVHHAENPGSKKRWWDFTAERKAYREENGYPSSRPKKPWFEVAKYRRS